jgi:hypothetical protein
MSEERFVRQYALVGKRARSKASDFPLDTLVQSISEGPFEQGNGIRAEHVELLNLCNKGPLSIAEIGAHLHVYLGVARVLVGDLIDAGLLVTSDLNTGDAPDLNSLERLLHDLKAL